jgi:chromosome segregation ATPase
VQRGRNEAVDMKERLEEIRRRQQALREQIGEVAEKRRSIEPVFEELKDRQRQLARSLDKIETNDGSNNFLELLKEFDSKTGPLQTRHQALQDSFALLVSLREGIAKSQNELVRLQTPETGVKALFGEVQAARENLAKSIQALETTSEGDALNTRVAALDAGKKEAEQRIVRLEGSYAVLDAVRRDLAELKKARKTSRRSSPRLRPIPTAKPSTSAWLKWTVLRPGAGAATRLAGDFDHAQPLPQRPDQLGKRFVAAAHARRGHSWPGR